MRFFTGLTVGAAIGVLFAIRRHDFQRLAQRRRVSAMTREQLYEQAKAADVEGRSKMTKDELREAVVESQPPLAAEVVQTITGRAADEPGTQGLE